MYAPTTVTAVTAAKSSAARRRPLRRQVQTARPAPASTPVALIVVTAAVTSPEARSFSPLHQQIAPRMPSPIRASLRPPLTSSPYDRVEAEPHDGGRERSCGATRSLPAARRRRPTPPLPGTGASCGSQNRRRAATRRPRQRDERRPVHRTGMQPGRRDEIGASDRPDRWERAGTGWRGGPRRSGRTWRRTTSRPIGEGPSSRPRRSQPRPRRPPRARSRLAGELPP